MKAEFHILRIFFGTNAERDSDVGWVAKEFTEDSHKSKQK